jgi:hypothetical protein
MELVCQLGSYSSICAKAKRLDSPMDVPLMTLIGFAFVCQVDIMPWPGARMSRTTTVRTSGGRISNQRKTHFFPN